MKKTIKLNHKILLGFFCLLISNAIFSQNGSATKTIFGKPISSKSKNPYNGKIRCSTMEYEAYLQEINPKRRTNTQFEAWLKPLVEKHKAHQAHSKMANTVITIPVVVHVIHSGQAIGTAPNIIDAQVQSQITVLNQDYRRMTGTPGFNSNPVGADIQIEFVLAKQDPNGNPTNGIDRINFEQQSWSYEECEATLKPATIWNPTQYLNMWTVKFSSDKLLGYAQFPDNNFNTNNPNYVPGLETIGGIASTDGVVSGFDVFGSNAFGSNFILAAPFNKGRTMTHEVGHWLGLLHIWGDGGNREENIKDCNATDYCDDTPAAGWENYECKVVQNSCPSDPGNDMVENYMDYTNDACMNIFTQNQKDRITTIMNNAARRASLKTSTKGNPITLNAIDAEVKIATINNLVDYGCSTSIPTLTNKKVTIYNRGTNAVTSVNLNYSINGGANQSLLWNGNLAQNQSVDVTLVNTNSNGTLNVSIVSTNGQTDQRTTNNTATRNYTQLTTQNYATTNFVFRLQRDYWGSETTWNITDSEGNIKYKGGPYSDVDESRPLPALITQNWTLEPNKCYTFTIDDSEADGICCGEGGNGYFDIKTSAGNTIVDSGTSFGAKSSKSFSTNSLGISEFDTLESIYLYPNPTKEILNIFVPIASGTPTKYSISNVLGQKIVEKSIETNADLSINTSSLSNGTYFITISKDNQSKTLQFVKE